MKKTKVNEHLKEKLKDPYFKELYELEQQKYDIVKKVIEYRLKEEMTQAQLAEYVGISQQHISKIENGEFSNVTTLEKVLLCIGMTVRIKAIELKPKIRKRIEKAMVGK